MSVFGLLWRNHKKKEREAYQHPVVGGDGALEVLLGTASHGWCVVLKVNKTREVGEEGVKRVVVCWHKEGKKALTHAHKEGEKKKKKRGKGKQGI